MGPPSDQYFLVIQFFENRVVVFSKKIFGVYCLEWRCTLQSWWSLSRVGFVQLLSCGENLGGNRNEWIPFFSMCRIVMGCVFDCLIILHIEICMVRSCRRVLVLFPQLKTVTKQAGTALYHVPTQPLRSSSDFWNFIFEKCPTRHWKFWIDNKYWSDGGPTRYAPPLWVKYKEYRPTTPLHQFMFGLETSKLRFRMLKSLDFHWNLESPKDIAPTVVPRARHVLW